jgi:hypothetical protein
MTCDFSGKPRTSEYFAVIGEFLESLGPSEREEKAQVSYGVKRKFAWFWVYEQTRDGTLYMNVTVDRQLSDPVFHNVTQVSPNRWNHHIEVKSRKIATSAGLKDLVRAGYAFASS